jgi:hypothetical protein
MGYKTEVCIYVGVCVYVRVVLDVCCTTYVYVQI